jgi:hypothetical protein
MAKFAMVVRGLGRGRDAEEEEFAAADFSKREAELIEWLVAVLPVTSGCGSGLAPDG